MAASTPKYNIDPDQPTTMLTAVTVSTTSQQFALPPARMQAGLPHSLTVQVIDTGAPTISVQFEGSLDGTNFVPLGSPITAAGITQLTTLASIIQVASTITGGTSPTLTVIVQPGT